MARCSGGVPGCVNTFNPQLAPRHTHTHRPPPRPGAATAGASMRDKVPFVPPSPPHFPAPAGAHARGAPPGNPTQRTAPPSPPPAPARAGRFSLLSPRGMRARPAAARSLARLSPQRLRAQAGGSCKPQSAAKRGHAARCPSRRVTARWSPVSATPFHIRQSPPGVCPCAPQHETARACAPPPGGGAMARRGVRRSRGGMPDRLVHDGAAAAEFPRSWAVELALALAQGPVCAVAADLSRVHDALHPGEALLPEVVVGAVVRVRDEHLRWRAQRLNAPCQGGVVSRCIHKNVPCRTDNNVAGRAEALRVVKAAVVDIRGRCHEAREAGNDVRHPFRR